ncbi:F0F1 ATP synthase subunit delta [Marinobacterium sp. LSUCC0821]|jgi:F-type H+-transporting ATPase subunit delta|uniref:F0F1 ATP synthase subunit delta n=1 Tax=Marinobacterium sp. LSUCC0821 TaxID=2668067 RepID=UPI00145206F1|nr:F0F1 ATP synthase subunit delta [Marinobacterium sp. LSUCC0821]QJD71870.1 F0F1 ATP synthase subunit delta [Marinobacterium sp. LSUCC0821]
MAELNTVARPYTKAAFEYAASAGSLDQWATMLSTAAAVVADETVARVLATPALTSEQKAATLNGLLEGDIDQAGQNFVAVLAENQRLALLPEIALQFKKLKAAQEASIDVDLTTAFELADDQQQKLAKALSTKLGREVSVTSQVDKSILGGVIVRTDDLVIDGSVRARLAKLAEAMNS